MGLENSHLRKFVSGPEEIPSSQCPPEKLQEYEFDEILSDAFSYSIQINKIHLSFYFYRVYKEDVFVSKEESISNIIQTLEDHDTDRVSIIPYLEERLYLLEILSTDIEYESAQRVLQAFSDLLDFSSKIEAQKYDEKEIAIIE